MDPFAHSAAGPAADPLVVLLHGFMGTAQDLAPFARSLGAKGQFIFPEGIVDLAPHGLHGRAWWPVDTDARAQATALGPRDLSHFFPDGLDRARAHLDALLDSLAPLSASPRPLVLGGFSQGAMLACDAVLRSNRPVAGVAFFSGARITASRWAPLYAKRQGLPIFMSHGDKDDDLSFTAAQSFQEELTRAGWQVTFCAFDGGHAIPLVAWRAFKRWLGSLG